MFLAFGRHARSQAILLHWRWAFARCIRSARDCSRSQSHEQHAHHFARDHSRCNFTPLRQQRLAFGHKNQGRCRHRYGFGRGPCHRLFADEHILVIGKCRGRCLHNTIRLHVHSYSQADRRLPLRNPFCNRPRNIHPLLPQDFRHHV